MPPQGKSKCLQLLNHSFRKVSVPAGRAGDRFWPGWRPTSRCHQNSSFLREAQDIQTGGSLPSANAHIKGSWKEKKHDQRTYFATHTYFDTFFLSFHFAGSCVCPSAPALPHLQLNSFFFPHVQYDLSLDCDSVLQAIFKKILVSVCANLYLWVWISHLKH